MAITPNGVRKILVISGTRLIAEAIAATLSERGFRATHEVATPMRRWSRSVVWEPHLALIDAGVIENEEHWHLLEQLRIGAVVIAAMSVRVDARTLELCLDAGASVLIDMNSPFDGFVETIHRVIDDRNLVEGRTRAELTDLKEREIQIRDNESAPFDYLTPRERHVLGEIMEGRSAEGIAHDSWVAVSTVRSQIKSILQKLGVNSQVAAVALARQASWSPGEDERRNSPRMNPSVAGGKGRVDMPTRRPRRDDFARKLA